MNHFFNALSVDEIIQILQKGKIRFDSKRSSVKYEELVHILEAENRVLCRSIRAREDVPLGNRATMDGYALHASDTFGASDSNPILLKNVMNFNIDDIPEGYLNENECAGVVTGGIIPQGADSVIMAEYCEDLGNDTIEIRKSLAPTTNIMLQGEDVQANTVALESGTFLKAQEIGMIAALGVQYVPVFAPIQVGVLSTGDEVMPIDADIRKGQVRDVNSYAIAALVKKVHAKPNLYGIVRDNVADLSEKLREMLKAEHEVVLLSGGSSVGTRDFTIKALQEIEGCEILCHGIAMSPGKPVIFALYKDTLICGLPGQIISAQIVMHRLILPYIEYLSHNSNAFDVTSWNSCQALLDRNIASKHGREDYVRVELYKENEILMAKPILGHSGLMKTLLKSDGMIKIDAKREGIDAGSKVQVFLFD